MKTYSANVLFSEMPAAHPQFSCTVKASDLWHALKPVVTEAKRYKGRRPIVPIQIIVKMIEIPKSSPRAQKFRTRMPQDAR